ncbi:MAG: type I phosphomannose isomerase catalytic subunit [Planctomycetota bacterium]|nr:type I phosphomannose isomerase catalytic subunit [Planctomycetota bacterium]
MTSPYPLQCRPILMHKVWGGDRLARFGKDCPAGATIGESWEAADLDATSASGAGGGAQRSVVVNGALAGKTLGDAVRTWGAGLLGAARPTGSGGFPLLVKFLDARENLSIQVHPSPAYAAAHPGAHLKTECWYILDAAPGSVLYKGLRPGETRESLAARVRDGTVVEALRACPAKPGEIHNLPSGTVHALGAGVLVAEVQTPSDTTFRLYDWGRSGRELHIDQCLACVDLAPPPPEMVLRSAGDGFGPTLRTDFFRVRHLSLGSGQERPLEPDGRCAVVMVLAGAGSLYHEDGAYAPTDVAVGQTFVVPAGVSAETTACAADDARLECLVATVG